jgi:hypothetical protein
MRRRARIVAKGAGIAALLAVAVSGAVVLAQRRTGSGH